MDARVFDDVTRSLSAGTSRRRFLAGLAALSLLAASQDAETRNRKRKRKNKYKNKNPNSSKHDSCDGKECGGKCGDCRHGKICRGGMCVCPDETEECGGKCVNLLTDAKHCGACDSPCPSAVGCRHGTCTCDPFNNTCPQDNDGTGQCTCGAAVANQFEAACVDRNSACDLDKPCLSDNDCPARSVCLRGCSDPPTPPDPNHNPNRCSKPCN